jgi:electron transfer flavoprotein alpha subunit
MPGILIVAEALDGGLAPTSLELASEARRLADQAGQPLAAVLMGKGVSGAAAGLGEYGVERVYVADSDAAVAPSPEWFQMAAEAAVQQAQPSIVLLTHSAAGRLLGPALANRLDTAVVTDATALRMEGDRLVITKPVYGGSALAEQQVTTSPQMATLRPRAFQAAEPRSGQQAQVEPLQVPATGERVEVLEEVREEAASGPKLKDAKIVVSGGRGLGGAENWQYVEELAQVLGAAVGASRAVTDAGWVSPSHQVGLTGATVAPDLYIAIGISGAVQHIAGISGARNVVAINRDADANIFKYARFGVLGDWKAILPAFTQRLKELRS